MRNFPGSFLVKIPCFHCRGAQVQSLVMELTPCNLAKTKKMKRIGLRQGQGWEKVRRKVQDTVTLSSWVSAQFGTSQFSSVAQLCPTLREPIDCSTPTSLSITNSQSLLRLMSIESVMPSNHLILCRPLLPFPAFSLSQNQGLFKWITSNQLAKVVEFQLQHQSFQWIFRTDFL